MMYMERENSVKTAGNPQLTGTFSPLSFGVILYSPPVVSAELKSLSFGAILYSPPARPS
jgi:hypothetical protein